MFWIYSLTFCSTHSIPGCIPSVRCQMTQAWNVHIWRIYKRTVADALSAEKLKDLRNVCVLENNNPTDFNCQFMLRSRLRIRTPHTYSFDPPSLEISILFPIFLFKINCLPSHYSPSFLLPNPTSITSLVSSLFPFSLHSCGSILRWDVTFVSPQNPVIMTVSPRLQFSIKPEGQEAKCSSQTKITFSCPHKTPPLWNRDGLWNRKMTPLFMGQKSTQHFITSQRSSVQTLSLCHLVCSNQLYWPQFNSVLKRNHKTGSWVNNYIKCMIISISTVTLLFKILCMHAFP